MPRWVACTLTGTAQEYDKLNILRRRSRAAEACAQLPGLMCRRRLCKPAKRSYPAGQLMLIRWWISRYWHPSLHLWARCMVLLFS